MSTGYPFLVKTYAIAVPTIPDPTMATLLLLICRLASQPTRGDHCHDADRRLPCEAFCDTGEIFLIMFYRVLWYTNQDLWEYQARTHSLTKSTRRSVKTTHGSARRYTSQSANHRVRKLARMG